MTTSPYKIALIVLYFGSLPPYFPVWLHSAEANPDIDFLFFTDREINIDAPNFRVTKITLDDLRRRFERTLNRPLVIPNGYKLCDYRPAYGLLFEEELRGYDFWGYCDIDLVFGRIRHFLADKLLSAYDRFYQCGHLSVYRNNETMRRAFELSGGCPTVNEMFSPVHWGADESAGINPICLKNHIPWYTNVDFAAISPLTSHLTVTNGRKNYPVQAFYYLDGRAFHRYAEEGQIKEDEVLYIHWLKRQPVIEDSIVPGSAVILTADKLLVRPPEELTPENMRLWNPPVSESEWKAAKRKKRLNHARLLLTESLAFKRMWLKRKIFLFLNTKLKYRGYP